MNRPFNYVISDELVLSVSEISCDLERIRPLSMKDSDKRELEEKKYESMLAFAGYTKEETGGDDYSLRLGNLRNAYEYSMKADVFSTDSFLEMHRILTEGICGDGGRFREGSAAREVSPSGRVLPSASAVPQFMKDLLEWTEKARVHPLIKAAVFFIRCIGTMPFTEQNVLAADIWISAILSRQLSPVFECMPLESSWIGSEKEYAVLIRDSYHYSDCGRYLDFFATGTLDALKTFISRSGSATGGSEISGSVQKLLDVMDEKAYSTKELMAMTGLRHRQTFRDNYLLPAMRLGYIRMTVPDKPNSRNQKYVKV